MFNILEESKAECAIKIRRNASTSHCRGSKRRRKEIREYQEKGYEEWSKDRSYGMRWVVEGIFSNVKRGFGENTVSKRRDSLICEAIQRFWAYDVLSTTL